MDKPVFYDNRVATIGRVMDVLVNFMTLADSVCPPDDKFRDSVHKVCTELNKRWCDKVGLDLSKL